jgi:hypothetical protein
MLSQYYKGTPPVIRTNCSYNIIFPSSLQELEKIAEEQTPPNMNKKEFIKNIQYATEDEYSFMSINSRAKPQDRLRKGFNNILN